LGGRSEKDIQKKLIEAAIKDKEAKGKEKRKTM